jgi:Protein of unknown function (DUF3617)
MAFHGHLVMRTCGDAFGNVEDAMRIAMAIALPIAALGAGAIAEAKEASLLQLGEYRVAVRIELPHLEHVAGAKVDTICVTAGDTGTHGLMALSDHNPLRQCPASNVLQSSDSLTFDIVCPGSDAAVGAARYTMQADSFDGAITVKMGGKNMTMIERQSGRRVGNCK